MIRASHYEAAAVQGQFFNYICGLAFGYGMKVVAPFLVKGWLAAAVAVPGCGAANVRTFAVVS